MDWKNTPTEKQMKAWELLAEEFSDTEIPVEGAVNVKSKPISEYKVRLAYGELTLIVAMLRDYVKELDARRENGTIGINALEYNVYYRPKFMNMADRISKQIGYDYDAQIKKCIEKMSKQSNGDVGEEALALTVKRSGAHDKRDGSKEDDAT